MPEIVPLTYHCTPRFACFDGDVAPKCGIESQERLEVEKKALGAAAGQHLTKKSFEVASDKLPRS